MITEDHIVELHNHMEYLEARINDILYMGIVIGLITFAQIDLLNTPKWLIILIGITRPVYYIVAFAIGWVYLRNNDDKDEDEGENEDE